MEPLAPDTNAYQNLLDIDQMWDDGVIYPVSGVYFSEEVLSCSMASFFNEYFRNRR
jgi:hypothetical protein